MIRGTTIYVLFSWAVKTCIQNTPNPRQAVGARVPSRKPRDHSATVSPDFTVPIPYQPQNPSAVASIHCGCSVELQEVSSEPMELIAAAIAKFKRGTSDVNS